MKKKTIIAPVNPDSESSVLFAPIKEFTTERVILLASTDGIVRAESVRDEFGKLGIPVSIVNVKPGTNTWEDYFVAVAEVLEGQVKENIIINIASADRISQCALTNAAHVNGIRAVAVIDGNVMLLPILKLSVSSVLSDKKMRMLRELGKNKCFSSLEDLSKATGMSLQLASYHVNGTAKSPGLVQLELVDIEEGRSKTRVCLSTMGRLFMRGYLG